MEEIVRTVCCLYLYQDFIYLAISNLLVGFYYKHESEWDRVYWGKAHIQRRERDFHDRMDIRAANVVTFFLLLFLLFQSSFKRSPSHPLNSFTVLQTFNAVSVHWSLLLDWVSAQRAPHFYYKCSWRVCKDVTWPVCYSYRHFRSYRPFEDNAYWFS